MTLNFPNESRSYEARGNLIRFWGYDSALVIPFFVEVSALHKLYPLTRTVEAGYLEAFDAVRDRIRSMKPPAKSIHEAAKLPTSWQQQISEISRSFSSPTQCWCLRQGAAVANSRLRKAAALAPESVFVRNTGRQRRPKNRSGGSHGR